MMLYLVFCWYLCLCCIVSASLPNFQRIKIYIFSDRIVVDFRRNLANIWSAMSENSIILVFQLDQSVDSNAGKMLEEKKQKNATRNRDRLNLAAHTEQSEVPIEHL